MREQVLLNVSIKKELEGGYSVVCTDLDVASQGETIEEAMENITEAVELYMESARELGIIDEVLERLGLSREDLKKGVSIPKIFRAEIPVRLAG